MNIYLGITRDHAIKELTRLLDEIRSPESLRSFDVTLYGKANLGQGDINIVFNNDDMENRPEVAESIFVDIDD